MRGLLAKEGRFNDDGSADLRLRADDHGDYAFDLIRDGSHAAAIPEPGSAALMLAGLGGLLVAGARGQLRGRAAGASNGRGKEKGDEP